MLYSWGLTLNERLRREREAAHREAFDAVTDQLWLALGGKDRTRAPRAVIDQLLERQRTLYEAKVKRDAEREGAAVLGAGLLSGTFDGV